MFIAFNKKDIKMTNFNWVISKLVTSNAKEHSNVVVVADVVVTGSRNNHQTGMVKKIEFELDTSKNFVVFENLTEEIVLGWVFEQLNEAEQAYIKNSIDAELDILEHPLPKHTPIVLTEQKLPWGV
jgi:hypothetical protein